jgi:hypothetical protein
MFFNRNSKQCLKITSELRNSNAEKNFLYSGLKKLTCNIVFSKRTRNTSSLISFKENNKWYSHAALKATVQFHEEIWSIFDGAAHCVFLQHSLLSGDCSNKTVDLHSQDTTFRIWSGVLLILSPPQPRSWMSCTDDGTTFEVDQDHALPLCGVEGYVQASLPVTFWISTEHVHTIFCIVVG